MIPLNTNFPRTTILAPQEGVLRVETRLENVAREMDLAMGTLRGAMEFMHVVMFYKLNIT